MKRKTGKAAICTAAVLSVSMLMSTVSLAAVTEDAASETAEVELVAVSCEDEDAWTQVAIVDEESAPEGLNIRSEARQDSDILGYLYGGTAVWVIDKGDDWTECYSNGITGYVKSDYLLYDSSAEAAAQSCSIEGVRTSWDDVNVYTSTSADTVKATLDAGASYQLVSDDGQWSEIRYDSDTTAYVSDEDVTKVLLLEPATPRDGERIELSEIYSSVSGSAAEPSYDADYTYEDYEEVYEDDNESYYEETYDYEESYDDGYEETYEVTYEESWDDYYYEDYDSYEETYVETVSSSGSSEIDALWQAYLEAQAAADAATQQADVQLVYDTYNAAVAAYQAYLNALNGTSAEAEYLEPSTSYTEPTETYTETYVEYVEETEAYVAEETTTSSTSSASADDLTLLASIIYCEAGNQSYEGMVAVGAVVMNRVYSSSFPDTISGVIYQSGQFTPASNGMLSSALANGVGDTYYSAAQDALAGTDPTGGCLYFNTSHGSGLKIGDHWFY